MNTGIDNTLFHLINDAHTPWLDGCFGVISGLGDGLVVALLCALLMLFHLRLGLASLLAFAISGLLAQLLKRLFDTPRPAALLEHVHVLGSTLTTHSFPSGHATSDGVMVLAALLLWRLHDWRSWTVAGLFVVAAIGRIYGGAHFPVDVMAGLLLGITTMWAMWHWSARWPVERWQVSEWSWKIPGLIVAVLAAVLGLGYHMQPSTAQSLALILPVASLMILLQQWKKRVPHEQ
ncbi:phosphatase PAP2 family protein [Mariprofundus erugo]|uniref:Phosphatase PAP2 family protein n=1 Tax=Mariprofundus erugo TaxID=2528639 RepID=A0A5R9GKB7_9PROT|nr:phosphatase PAP2 family protein [Mariprofundus erugo]TLS65645.1 phosphatase PAP2 family protein [Mariprofundus erugo]TLS75658.1 phosphatase PAP2 family protein [Mariprofundus erugo]